jgi:hypothetical protein
MTFLLNSPTILVGGVLGAVGAATLLLAVCNSCLRRTVAFDSVEQNKLTLRLFHPSGSFHEADRPLAR